MPTLPDYTEVSWIQSESPWAFSIYKKFGHFPMDISVWEEGVPFDTHPICSQAAQPVAYLDLL